MDNGHVIHGLDEGWTLLGAKLMEWVAGFVALIIGNELFFHKIGQGMPILFAIWVATTMGLASLRRSFPDEERGVRNYFLTLLGFAPPGIPAPQKIQPVWSACPIRQLKEDCAFKQLDLDKVLIANEQDVTQV